MKKKVLLKDNWTVRSTQDGVDIVSAEKNISISLPDPKNQRRPFKEILLGQKPLPKNSDLLLLINELANRKVFNKNSRKRRYKKENNLEKKLWKIRNEFVGSRGPISTVYKIDSSKSSFSSSLTHAFSAKYIIQTRKKEGWTGGCDENVELAELKAIMEALERWSSGVIDKKKLIKSSANSLGDSAIDPREFIKYADRQYERKLFKLNKFNKNNIYYWKEVYEYSTKKKFFLPVECLYYPIDEKLTPNIYTFSNSSGVAAGFSMAEALFRGLYEAVERDAFMNVWINKLSMPKYKNSSLPKKIRNRINDFNKLGYEVFIVDITLDLSPVILAIAVNKKRRPALIISGASSFNKINAISKALDEAEYILSWQLRFTERIRILSNSRKATGVLDHIAVFADPRKVKIAKFLWEGKEILFKESIIKKKNSEIVTLFRKKGIKILIADMTPDILKQQGIFVIRAIPLGLIPISFGYGLEPLGMKRLKKFSTNKQWNKDTPYLHPFA